VQTPQSTVVSTQAILQPVQAQETCINSVASNIPHPAKMATGGEDASFSCSHALGVADGVGGWSAHGIDAGEYARGLMNAAKDSIDTHGYSDPLAVLWHAYRNVSSLGSSTCLIICLDGERSILHSANLGDSGFRVIRNSAIIYRCKVGQHYFNCPHQLGSHSSDLPSDAMRHSMNVQVGDIIVSGSDGLFDNLFDADIVAIVNEYNDNIPVISQQIANAARQASGNSMRQGPFAVEANASGIQFQGGKFDDVTVVVSRIEAASTVAAEPAPAAVESAPLSRIASGSGPKACKFLQSAERKGATAKYGSKDRDDSG